MRAVSCLVGLAVCAAVAGGAGAQPAPAPSGGFGPVVTIESIEVVGNRYTAEKLIRRALPVREGDVVQGGDPRLAAARFKVLALGYFREVDLALRKGTSRGRVVLSVRVEERGTVVLNRMFFGNTLITPWWAGLDLTERNFFGTGVGVGGAFVIAGEGNEPGATRQGAYELRLEDTSIAGGPFGAHVSGLYVDASEPYRVAGDPSDGAADNFAAFDYRRVGGRVGFTAPLSLLTRLTAVARFEAVRAALPAAPTRTLPDGTVVPVDLLLEDGDSRLATVGALLERDTRPDPILPFAGYHLLLLAEAGGAAIGSSYDFASVYVRAERWWSLRPGHVVSVHCAGSAVIGDAPLFEHVHVGDVDRMVSPRALGLVVSTTPPFDFFGTGVGGLMYGEIAGIAEAQYAYRLFRNHRTVYGGDLFVGAGLWTLHATRDVGYDAPVFPVDLLLDAGLRLDTEIGIFELSLANGLGRIPL